MRGVGQGRNFIVAALLAAISFAAFADEDSRITDRVRAALVAAQIPNADAIEVKTFNGEVDLSGVVHSEHGKARAASVAGVVSGVKAVKNDLQVQEQAPDGDDALANRVRKAFTTSQIENAASIQVKSFNGEVDLVGVVYSEEDKAKAAGVAGAVRGVAAVKNDLQVREP
jgi:osmotically-inducible protein OsmY